MPSPFPGMNPYLERSYVWQDFHGAFLAYMREALSAQVREKYLVHIDEHVYIRELPRDQWRPLGRPDVAIARRPDAPVGGVATAAGVEAGDVIELMVTHDELPKRYLQILDRRNREVVTVLELLSPSNKEYGSDRQQYLNKRLRVLVGPASLVEIDLLRGGPRLPLGDEPMPPCDYYALVSRAHQRPTALLLRRWLRQRLPVVPIPLRPDDGDVALDLQTVLDRVYDAGTYEAEVYADPPEPPLADEDAAWARQFVPH